MKRSDAKSKPSTGHRMGWVRPSPWFPAGPQIEAIKATGVKVIFNAAADDTIDLILRSVRPGDEVVVYGASRLGETRPEIVAVLEAVRIAGGTVLDLQTGAAVTIACLEAALAVMMDLNKERRLPSKEVASERGKKGGKPKTAMKVSPDKALEIWRDPSLSTAIAAQRIGMMARACYRHLGPRGTPAGWPSKTKPKKL